MSSRCISNRRRWPPPNKKNYIGRRRRFGDGRLAVGGLAALDSQNQAGGGLPRELKMLDRIDEAVTGLGEALDDLQEALERLRETIGGASQ